MIICLESSILNGYLSNEVPGLVTGYLQVAGRSQPLRVELQGNFLRDIAGCRVDLLNPCPDVDDTMVGALLPTQYGQAGVMTGSHRVASSPRRAQGQGRVGKPMVLNQEPAGLKNMLFFEWFNEQGQRVLIQSWHLSMRVSAPRWSMEAADEQAMLRQNRRRRREFFLKSRDAAARGSVQDPFQAEDEGGLAAMIDPGSDPFEGRHAHAEGGEDSLPDPLQRGEALVVELRLLQNLLAGGQSKQPHPALLRLLSTVADLAAHLAHALRQYLTVSRQDTRFLRVDLEQSLPMFCAALEATEKLLGHQANEAVDRHWLEKVRGGLFGVELRIRELLAILA
jgi:hypothetical protein